MIDPDDERTALSARGGGPRRQAPAPVDRTLDDPTLPTRRAGGAAADPGVTAPEAPAPRRSSAPPVDVDVTAVSARSRVPSDSEFATQAATASGRLGPRRGAPPAGGDAGDEDTNAARRNARATSAPTATPTPPTPAAPGEAPAPGGRIAFRPEPAPAAHRARPLPPAAASRAEPAPRAPQTYVDTAAAEAGRRRRARRRMAAAVVAASVLVVAAVVLLAVLLTTG